MQGRSVESPGVVSGSPSDEIESVSSRLLGMPHPVLCRFHVETCGFAEAGLLLSCNAPGDSFSAFNAIVVTGVPHTIAVNSCDAMRLRASSWTRVRAPRWLNGCLASGPRQVKNPIPT